MKEFFLLLSLVFGGCCSNTTTLESIIKIQKNCGNIILLFQFLFTSIEGLVNNIQFHNPLKKFPISLKPRKAPLYKWFIVVILFFSSSVINNLVFKYHISMPVHIIFRSSSIIITIIMSRLILKTRYSIQQISSILIVTVGLIIVTISSGKKQNQTKEEDFNLKNWIKGIILLLVSSVIGALMGIYQEYMLKTYPGTWKECLFYKHFLSLPVFIFLFPQIKEQWQLFQATPKYPLKYYFPYMNMFSSISDIKIQGIWIYVAFNIITQYVCISSILKLSSLCSSVTLTLILNIRKFTSLIISVIMFKNAFPLWSWIGSVLVFVGVVWYAIATDKYKKQKTLESEKSGINEKSGVNEKSQNKKRLKHKSSRSNHKSKNKRRLKHKNSIVHKVED